MAMGAVHHHLVNLCLRQKVGIIVETGEAKWVLFLALEGEDILYLHNLNRLEINGVFPNWWKKFHSFQVENSF
jgi:hypothetical protein